jgi:hypothetical protein
MDSFYHSVYGITPYVPPNNLAPVVDQNATVSIATSASSNAVFSQAVFTSLILMSVTSGLNQGAAVENKTTAVVPDRTSFYEEKRNPGPAVPDILPTGAPAIARSVKDVVFVPTTSSKRVYRSSRDRAVTWPKTTPSARKKVTVPPSTVRPQQKPTYPPWIRSYEYFTTATTTTTTTVTKKMPTTSTVRYVPFNIPRQEIALKKETATIEKEKFTDKNKVVSEMDLLAMKRDNGETTIGVEFWTAAVVMLSLAIISILVLYAVIYHMGRRIIFLASSQKSYQPVETVDMTMRLNEIERKFLACKRKIEEKEEKERQQREKERQQRSVAATHPERLLTVRSFNAEFSVKNSLLALLLF